MKIYINICNKKTFYCNFKNIIGANKFKAYDFLSVRFTTCIPQYHKHDDGLGKQIDQLC
jgi:hypothetical protein